MTSLEEVFLKANGAIEGFEKKERRTSSINDDGSPFPSMIESNGSFNPGTPAPMQSAISPERIEREGSFCGQVGALLTKRFNLYRRDACGLVCEILVPLMLVILGLGLLKVGWLYDSPSFVLDTSAYPGPQRLLFNQDLLETTKQYYTP